MHFPFTFESLGGKRILLFDASFSLAIFTYMNPSPEQLRLCAYLMENPEVPWRFKDKRGKWRNDIGNSTAFGLMAAGGELATESACLHCNPHPKYSREGKTLLILHNHDCDQFGDITGESPSHLWFTRHGGYFKLSLESGEVETLKSAEF